MPTETHIKTNKIITLLSTWLKTRASDEGLAWLSRKQKEIAQNAAERTLFTKTSVKHRPERR